MKKLDKIDTTFLLLLILLLAWISFRWNRLFSAIKTTNNGSGNKFNEANIGIQPTATHTTNGNGNGNGTIGLGNTGMSSGMPGVPGCTLFGCTDPLALNYYPGACADSPATPCCYSYNDCCDKGIYSPSVCGE